MKIHKAILHIYHRQQKSLEIISVDLQQIGKLSLKECNNSNKDNSRIPEYVIRGVNRARAVATTAKAIPYM